MTFQPAGAALTIRHHAVCLSLFLSQFDQAGKLRTVTVFAGPVDLDLGMLLLVLAGSVIPHPRATHIARRTRITHRHLTPSAFLLIRLWGSLAVAAKL